MSPNVLKNYSVLLCILFGVGISSAAKYSKSRADTVLKDSLCSFAWNANFNDCPQKLSCIQPAEWNGTTKNVPANITRIMEDSLKLCLQKKEFTKPADIIYIMDFSGSMTSDEIISGDPDRVRAKALKAGFTTQYYNFPSSRAGYLGFGAQISPTHFLPPVDVTKDFAQLQAMSLRCDSAVELDPQLDLGNTNYTATLRQSLKWALNPTLCPDEVKAIIFISDGKPTKQPGNTPDPVPVSLIDSLVKAKLSVHGVFLSSSAAEGADLINLATATNGSYTRIIPANAKDSLAKVVTNIVQKINKKYVYKNLSVTNYTINPNPTSTALSATNFLDTIWIMKLNKFVPLQPGRNDIAVKSTFAVEGSTDSTNLNFAFIVNVGGQAPTKQCYWCWQRAKLQVLVNNVVKDQLSWKDKNYTIQLIYNGPDTLSSVNVSVNATLKGDAETITLTNPKFNGTAWVFEKTVPFSVLVPTTPATANNGTTEAAYKDSIYLKWKHPVSFQDTAVTSVKVTATPDSLRLYSLPGDPQTMTPYPTYPDTVTAYAGTAVQLYAKVFANLQWLSEYETNATLGNQIKWEWVNDKTNVLDTSIGVLTLLQGNHNTYMPKKAFHKVRIKASIDIGIGAELTRTILLSILPGTAKALWIEASNDFTKTTPNKPSPWNPIVMQNNTSTLKAFAIFRDTFGNWISPATQAAWSVDNASVVTVSPGPSDTGTITKGSLASGTTQLHASQSGLTGHTTVNTENYDIDSVRIVIKNATAAYVDIDNLSMTTNDDTTLYALGLRSDTKVWIPIGADWAISDTVVKPGAPKAALLWSFSPTQPGTGTINATYSGKNDQITFTFTVGSPVKAEFVILDPDSLLIAGRAFKTKVSLYNKDGMIKGTFRYPKGTAVNGGVNPAQYGDILGTGGLKYIPFAVTYLNGVMEDVDSLGDTKATIVQTFVNGIDTLLFTLFYAPPQKYFHQLTVYLDNLTASTHKFILKPGPLDTILIDPSKDQYITPSDSGFVIKAKGYDPFGNFLPNEPYVWSNDTTLIDYKINAQADMIYFEPNKATKPQSGFVKVTSINYPSKSNKVKIIIGAEKSSLVSAVTRDFNGNGLLDLIELKFNKPFTAPPNFNDLAVKYITVANKSPDKIILVDSLGLAPLSDKTAWYLYLNEIESKAWELPQTAWKPYLTIDNLDSIKPIKNLQCSDGAAPVIWQAFKTVTDIYDRKKDVVKVTLSENFLNYKGVQFLSAGPKPELVFYVWKKSGSDFVRLDTILTGIPVFNDQKEDWTTFNMTNGKDLGANHYLNLDHLNGYVADNISNIPHARNQKVPIEVKGNVGTIIVGPVPVIPTLNNKTNPNKLENINKDSLKNFIKTNGGTGISVKIQLEVDKTTKKLKQGEAYKIKAALLVYDVAGNLTYAIRNDDDATPAEWKSLNFNLDNPIQELNFYWTGVSGRGTKCAPGVYNVRVFLTYNGEKRTYQKIVAVGR